MRVTLRVKFLLMITAVVLAMSSLILCVVGVLTGQELDRSVRASVHATGNVLVQLMRERTVALKNQCLTFARQPVFKAYLGLSDQQGVQGAARPDAATIADSLGEYLYEMHLAAALFTDRDGQSLGETDASRQLKRDCSHDPGVAAALRGDTWSGIQVRNGKLMLTVSVPVQIHNEVWGTFTAYSAVDSGVAEALKSALGSDVAFIYKGTVVGASLSTPAMLSAPRKAPQVVTVGTERYFALYSPLPDTRPEDSAGFVTLAPYERSVAIYRPFQMALIGAFILALLLAPAAGMSLANGITRPLDGVVKAARCVQDGAWPEPFSVKRSDEIGLLQTVFDEMTRTLRANQQRLLSLIDIDPLTELDNHRRFQERLTQEAKRCVASGEALSILMIDLDLFHDFNVEHGHSAGDAALRNIALILRNCLPEFAIIARYGGEEFVALLPRNDVREAESLAERIRSAVDGYGDRHDLLHMTVSIGCAEFGTHTTQAEGLVMAAELAVSRAKQLGRNRVCRFDSVPGADETADPYHLHRFLKDGSLATIQALAAAVDAKDPYTQGHSRRVAEYASLLAAWTNRSQSDIELIHTTGTLHDVGKDRSAGLHSAEGRASGSGGAVHHGDAPRARRSHRAESAATGAYAAGSSAPPRTLGRKGVSGRAGWKRHTRRRAHPGDR